MWMREQTSNPPRIAMMEERRDCFVFALAVVVERN